MPKLTIKEIAKIAGVSPSAVSIVLNNKTGVSEETRKKVSEIVERLQYIPNQNSRRLLFNKSNNIAVLFKKNASPLEHLFYSELNSVILHECESLNYNLIFTSVSVEGKNVILPGVIRSYDVDGVILYGDVDIQIINALKKFDLPFVIVDSHYIIDDTLNVYADYMVAAYTAASHLLELGHKSIAYIGNSTQSHFSAQTFSGYKKAIEECKLAIPMHWIQFTADDEETAYSCMTNILSSDMYPTAVFCAADIYAIGAVKCIRDKGFTIPQDISVIGIDDIILSKYIAPPLTTVKIDKVEMGKIAMELLVKQMEDPSLVLENKSINSFSIVERSTVKALSSN